MSLGQKDRHGGYPKLQDTAVVGHCFSYCPAASSCPLYACCKPIHQDTKLVKSGNCFSQSLPALGFLPFHPFLDFSFPTHSLLNQALLMVLFCDTAKEDEKNPPNQVVWVGRENPSSWTWLWSVFLAAFCRNLSLFPSDHQGGRNIPTLSSTSVRSTSHITFKTGCAHCPFSSSEVTAQNSFCVFGAERVQSSTDHLP